MKSGSSFLEGRMKMSVVIWRPILTGWLGWSPARFNDWVSRWDADPGGDFLHEHPLYWILPLLVPNHLADQLRKQRTRRMYNDLAELLYEELCPAILGTDKRCGSPSFDWNASRQRAEAVLHAYGARFPEPSEITSYETAILSRKPTEWRVSSSRNEGTRKP
jgi:hypothetical protein